MIRCLIPDLPDAAELAPWLARIDAQRWYTNNGPLVREFESRLVGFIDGARAGGCVTLSSGMSALELGLRALGIGAGRRVLLPSLTFPATALAVVRCGAEPVFADVCPQDWILTPAIARAAMKYGRFDAIVPVAAYGRALPADDWDRLSRDAGIPVLVDAAAALGVQRVGSDAHWAFSLHATKPMGVGEGGLVVTPQAQLAERIRRLANFDFDEMVVLSAEGTNAKLSEYAAAVGLAQLARWAGLLSRRREVFAAYRRALADLPGVSLQGGLGSPPATLCVQLPGQAAAVAEGLRHEGIETRRWYLPPLHRHPALASLGRIGPDGSAELPATEALAGTLLGLPFHTRLTDEDVAAVVRALAAQVAAVCGGGNA